MSVRGFNRVRLLRLNPPHYRRRLAPQSPPLSWVCCCWGSYFTLPPVPIWEDPPESSGRHRPVCPSLWEEIVTRQQFPWPPPEQPSALCTCISPLGLFKSLNLRKSRGVCWAGELGLVCQHNTDTKEICVFLSICLAPATPLLTAAKEKRGSDALELLSPPSHPFVLPVSIESLAHRSTRQYL